MPQVGFEPTIPVFERAKTVHALDRATHCDCRIFFSNFNFIMKSQLTVGLPEFQRSRELI
jgi:hypothetical protein